MTQLTTALALRAAINVLRCHPSSRWTMQAYSFISTLRTSLRNPYRLYVSIPVASERHRQTPNVPDEASRFAATAITITLIFLPRAESRRCRRQSLSCASQVRSIRGFGKPSCRTCMSLRTRAW